MSMKKAVSERILGLCGERGISLNKLANMCGITQSTLNNIVNQGSNNPTLSTIKKICDGLDITLENFFASPIFVSLEQEVR